MEQDYLEVNPITRRQLDDLWEIKATQAPVAFSEAMGRLVSQTLYPRDVVSALLEGKTPTAAWRLFRNISQSELAHIAGVSHTGLASIERGLSSGNQLRPKLACALAIPAEALIV